MKLSNQRINPDKANGIWFDTEFDGEPVSFKIASQKSRAFLNALLKLGDEIKAREKLTKERDLAKLYEEHRLKSAKLLATHILLDWKGFTDDEGKEIPYTVELGMEVVDDTKFPKPAEFISRKSQEIEAFMGNHIKAEIEEGKKD